MASTLGNPSQESNTNFELFRDCLSAVLVERLSPAPRKRPLRTVRSRRRGFNAKSDATGPSVVPLDSTDAAVPALLSTVNLTVAESGRQRDDDAAAAAEDLGEFVDYIAAASFTALPEDLRSLSYREWSEDGALRTRYPLPLTGDSLSNALPSAIDPHVVDSLQAYGVLSSPSAAPSKKMAPLSPVSAAEDLLAPVLNEYIANATAPPAPRVARGAASACEICERDWINLTYHHLIPRMVHEKVVRRGWHREDELQNVAWLCGACHRAVHQFASHEDLARHYYTVEKLLAQDEIAAFAAWVGKLRWKKK